MGWVVGRPAEFGGGKVGDVTRWGDAKGAIGREVVGNAGVAVRGVDRRRLVLSLAVNDGRRGFASIFVRSRSDERWVLGYRGGSWSW